MSTTAIIFTDDIMIEKLCKTFEFAKTTLAATEKPDAGDVTNFVPFAVVIDANGSAEAVTMPWTNAAEKEQLGRAISKTARAIQAQALVVTIVGTVLNMPLVLPELGIQEDRITPQTVDEFESRLFAWCEKLTGGRVLGRLPDKYFHDELLSTALGPRLAGATVKQQFEWVNGALQFIGEPELFDNRIHGAVMINFIPKWWD